MKAILCAEFGAIENLRYLDRPEPDAHDDAVVIEAEAIGMNYAEGLLVQGLYQVKPDTPFVPGMEVAGTVKAIGPHVTSIPVGARVAGLVTNGAYCEFVSVPEANVFPLPEHMEPAHACALLCAFGTAHHALKQRARLQPNETLAVFGASGSTGLAAVQIGKAMGARVIAVASSEEKREIARGAGADEALGYDDLRTDLKSVTNDRGVDVVFDPVGGAAFDAASRTMARGGRLLVIGFASGTIPKFPVNLALVKEYSVIGVFWGNFTRFEPEAFADNMRELFSLYEDGTLKPLIEGRHPLSEAASHLARMHRRAASGKIVLVPDRLMTTE